MRMASRRAIALWFSIVWLALPAAADPTPAEAFTPDIPAVDAAPSSTPAADLEYDAFYDDDFLDQAAPTNDPFEGTNRVFFQFNRGFDRFLLSPVTRAYRFAVPEPARQGLRRVFINLNSPSVLVNDLLQLRIRDAGETLGRFILNTTLGIGGLMDVGEAAGWKHHDADFGQTLAKFGVGPGPYLVLPIFGPNTLRDGLGDIVDIAFQPLTYLIGPTPNIAIGTGSGFTTLEAMGPAMEALEESSVDYYAALRSAYLQNRSAQVRRVSGASWD